MPTQAECLLEELVRARAPAGTLKAEGFTPREIAAARATVSLDTARTGSSDPMQLRPTHDTGHRQRGARGNTDATTVVLEGATTRGRGALEAREPARAAHSGNTGGQATV